MVDGDTQTARERLRVLDQALADKGERIIDEGSDRIARLVPKRNVETWILCLNLETADKENDFKHTKPSEEWSSLIPRAAETLYNWTRPNTQLRASALNSLRHGVLEICRILPPGE
jgi:hypothetical protein